MSYIDYQACLKPAVESIMQSLILLDHDTVEQELKQLETCLSNTTEDIRAALEFNNQSTEYQFLAKSGMLPLSRSTNPAGVWSYDRTDGVLSVRGFLLRPTERVFIFLNGRLLKIVNTTVARVSGVETSQFKYDIRKSVSDHFPVSNRIQLSSAQGYLAFRGTGSELADGVTIEQENGKGDLFQLLLSKHFITKYGDLALKQTHMEKWQKSVLSAYSSWRDYFKEHLGYDLFVIYGSLLGLVRDGDFILHDDDFDACFVSRETKPEAVKSELIQILERIKADKKEFEIDPSGGFCKLKTGGVKFDLFAGWIEDGKLWMSNTTRIDADRTMFEPAQAVDFKGTSVLIPNNPELFLTRKYGEGWRVPDPGYSPVLAPGTSEYLAKSKITKAEQIRLLSSDSGQPSSST